MAGQRGLRRVFAGAALAALAASYGLTRAGWDGRGPDEAEIASAIGRMLAGEDAFRSAPRLADVRESAASLYATPGPQWTSARLPTTQAVAAVAAIEDAPSHGLPPEAYDAPWLRRRLDSLSAAAAAGAGAVELAEFDLSLSVALLSYLGAVHGGRVRPLDAGFAYDVEPHQTDLGERVRRAITEERVEALPADLEPRPAQYRRLKAALAAERMRGGDGAAAVRIALALERLRWIPHELRGPVIVANVPAYRLAAFHDLADERPTLLMAIVVGKAARTQTPLFHGEIGAVVFRPSWYPPPSIIRGEIVPRLRRDPGYLRREGMEIVATTREGSPALGVTDANIDRLRRGALALRQRPGPGNALGLVKFEFPNEYRVYMHDTPARGLFARERRDFSHGCIRVERPADLAAFVLADAPEWTPARIEGAMKGTRTVRAPVEPAIPVFVFYTTAIVDADGTLELFDDVYGLDERLRAALVERPR